MDSVTSIESRILRGSTASILPNVLWVYIFQFACTCFPFWAKLNCVCKAWHPLLLSSHVTNMCEYKGLPSCDSKGFEMIKRIRYVISSKCTFAIDDYSGWTNMRNISKQLTHLNLKSKCNYMSIDFMWYFNNGNLTHLRLCHFKFDSPGICAIHTLTSIILQNTHLEPKGLIILSKIPNLTHLTINNTYVRVCQYLMNLTFNSLTHLKISDCSDVDDFCKIFHASKLEIFWIHPPHMYIAMFDIQEFLRRFPKLKLCHFFPEV